MTRTDGKRLTKAQRWWLERAVTLKRGQPLVWGVKSNAGGSIKRMLQKLKDRGLIEGPPYKITDAGRAALKTGASE